MDDFDLLNPARISRRSSAPPSFCSTVKGETAAAEDCDVGGDGVKEGEAERVVVDADG